MSSMKKIYLYFTRSSPKYARVSPTLPHLKIQLKEEKKLYNVKNPTSER